jgi:hypothetical protein
LVREDVNLSQEMRDIAGNTLEEREKKWSGKYQK